MKKPGFWAASVAAASATAASASSSSSSTTFTCNSNFQFSRQGNGLNGRAQDEEHSAPTSSGSENQFAPRFDGLRFIETLVTAHR